MPFWYSATAITRATQREMITVTNPSPSTQDIMSPPPCLRVVVVTGIRVDVVEEPPQIVWQSPAMVHLFWPAPTTSTHWGDFPSGHEQSR